MNIIWLGAAYVMCDVFDVSVFRIPVWHRRVHIHMLTKLHQHIHPHTSYHQDIYNTAVQSKLRSQWFRDALPAHCRVAMNKIDASRVSRRFVARFWMIFMSTKRALVVYFLVGFERVCVWNLKFDDDEESSSTMTEWWWWWSCGVDKIVWQ